MQWSKCNRDDNLIHLRYFLKAYEFAMNVIRYVIFFSFINHDVIRHSARFVIQQLDVQNSFSNPKNRLLNKLEFSNILQVKIIKSTVNSSIFN